MSNQFSHPWNFEDIKYLKAHYSKKPYKEIAAILGRSYSSVQSQVRNLKIYKRVVKHSINSNFFKTWTPDMAYVLEFITADGNIQHVKKGYHIHIACHDNDVIEKIKASIETTTPIRQKPRFNGKTSYSLRFSDKTIFYDLERLGIRPRKSLVVKPPIIPKEYVWHYIRGFFDGDGCVYKDNTPYNYLHLFFYTGSFSMAQFLLKTIKSYIINYKGKIRKITGKHAYRIHFGNKHSKIISQYLYQNATLFMQRKYQLLNLCI